MAETNKVKCDNCEWEGEASDLETDENSSDAGDWDWWYICPSCHWRIETDA